MKKKKMPRKLRRRIQRFTGWFFGKLNLLISAIGGILLFQVVSNLDLNVNRLMSGLSYFLLNELYNLQNSGISMDSLLATQSPFFVSVIPLVFGMLAMALVVVLYAQFVYSKQYRKSAGRLQKYVYSIEETQDTERLIQANQEEIRELLEELESAISSERQLEFEDKIAAREYLKAIAQVGQNPVDNVSRKAIRESVRSLRGMTAELPPKSVLTEKLNELVPEIKRIFRL